MTAQEKAKVLVERFNDCNKAVGSFITPFQVKQCALITVDEIMKTITFANYKIWNNEPMNLEFWQQVKEEIEKL